MKVIPQILIHGGAGSRISNLGRAEVLGRSMKQILDTVYPRMRRGMSAIDAVTLAVSLLEDDPLYNAGLGSRVQSDGEIRMSASLMDGHERIFSGCVNVTKVRNPVVLARSLQEHQDRVLGGDGALQMAKFLSLPMRSPLTKERKAEYEILRKARPRGKFIVNLRQHPSKTGRFDSNISGLNATGLGLSRHAGEAKGSQKRVGGKMGTVGAVACDSKGRLAAATSTGGRGFEFPHRISDSATVAGTFANSRCALSATGIGEQIVEFGLAVRLATYCELGRDLERSARSLLKEAKDKDLEFGFISVNQSRMVALTSTAHLIWASAQGAQMLLHP